MYQEKNHKRTRKSLRKSIALLVSLLLIIGVIVGGTTAFLIATDGPLENQFKSSQVTTEVEEGFDGTTKSNVSIKNTGDTEAWIRATVVVTWQDANGNVYGKAPVEGTDYDIVWESNSKWLSGGDDFYYYTSPVAPGNKTSVLINSCTSKDTAPEGYFLTVEIIGSGIQSKPSHVFNSEWSSSGLEVSPDGTSLQTATAQSTSQ